MRRSFVPCATVWLLLALSVPGFAQSDGSLLAQDHPNELGRWPAYYAGVRDAILGVGRNPVPAEDALQVLWLQDLGRTSARLRQELAVTAIPMNAQQESVT